jgi:hypothetical protein
MRNSSGAVAVLTKGERQTSAESKEREETDCSKLYDPCTKEEIKDFYALEKRVNEIKLQLSRGQFDISSSSSLLEFMTKVFLKPEINMYSMISSVHDPMAYILGKDIFHMLCILFCFFGGITSLEATYSGTYLFQRTSSLTDVDILEPKEAFEKIQCGASAEDFLSSISFRKVRERIIRSTEPYCETACDRIDSESINEYCIFFVPKISELYYDNNLVESIKKKVKPGVKPLLFMLGDKDDFKRFFVGDYEELHSLVGDSIYDFQTDMYPYLQKIRADIFQFANAQSISILESFTEQYLTKGMLPRLQLQLHQDIIVSGILDKIEKPTDNKYAVGVLARGGKTFIAGGIMREYLRRTGISHLNVFWITAAPNETRLQVQSELLEAFQDFQDFEFIEAKTVLQLSKTKSHAVFFCSSQLLLEATRKKSEAEQTVKRNYLSDLLAGKDEIGLVFFDEAHKTAKGYETFSQLTNLFTVYPTVPFLFLTATYYSILPVFGIRPENTFLWTYTDVLTMRMLGTDVGTEKALDTLHRQFGTELVDSVIRSRLSIGDTYESLSQPYKRYPDIYFLSADYSVEFMTSMEVLGMYSGKKGFHFGTIFELRKDGLSLNALLAQDKRVRTDAYDLFMNKRAIMELLNLFTPTEDVYEGFEATPLPKEQKVLMRMDTISRERKSRLNLEMNPSLLMFLPSGAVGTNIYFTVCAWASLLMSHPWWRDRYEVACVVEKSDIPKLNVSLGNAPTTGLSSIHFFERNLKENIVELERTLQCTKKKGLLILAGEKLGMGISLPCIDSVFLLNDKKAADDTIQKLYRALTPSEGKTTAFVVDLNPARSLSALYTYTQLSFGKDATPYDTLNSLYKTYAWDTDIYKVYEHTPDLLDLTLQGRLRTLYMRATVNETKKNTVAKQLQKLQSAFGSKIATTVRQKRVKKKTERNEENNQANANNEDEA